MIVIDASIAVDLVLGLEPALGHIEDEVIPQRTRLAAPHLLEVEVGQVLRRFVRGGELDPARAAQALEDLADLPIHRYPHTPLLQRAFALRDNVTFYDAVYLALTEALEAELLTRDRALAGVPRVNARVKVI